ncbi:MAG: TIM barrel protein [Acidobacteria bacterium]|nr:TIM barrel protein [Acidobacteriota bacterium]
MPASRRAFLSLFPVVVSAAPARIRPGCQTRAYGSPIREKERLLAVLDEIAATGFEGFETNFASLEHSFDNPDPMRREIEKRGLALIGLHTSPKLHVTDTAAREMRAAQRIARAIQALGGSLLVCSGSGMPRTGSGMLDPKTLELWCSNLNDLGRFCRDLGVRLAIHNHGKELENNAQELDAVMGATAAAHVWLLADISYCIGAGIRAEDVLARYASRLAGIHIRDLKNGKEVLLGTGELDTRAVAEALRAVRWSGWAILEMNRRADMSSREMIMEGRRHMKQVMQI